VSKHPIGTVVNFCTNESRFISACLKQALRFSSQVIVPVASHFFDGNPENRALLEQIYQAFPECLFLEYPFIPHKIPKVIFKHIRPEAFWHCLSRLIGVAFLERDLETILFLDADEVADGKGVSEWLDASDYKQHTALKFANYWYFREPLFQAESFEDSVVLVQKRALKMEMLLQDEERNALYDSAAEPKRRGVLGTSGKPLFHHFSWVRTEEEMLRKVKSWGHRKDRDWEGLVRREFAAPFQGVDFVHGYRFHAVDIPFELTSEFENRGKKNVVHLSEGEVIAFAKMKKPSLFQRLRDCLF
jgi:hypothetical protein